MAQELYSPQKLLELGRVNYEKMAECCELLEKGGFWLQAQKIMKQSCQEVLDLYVQSVLLGFTLHCGSFQKKQREYILAVTNTNPLEIPDKGDLEEEIIQYGQKIEKMPPILIQLCGVCDRQGNKKMAAHFMDAMINILLCMAYLNEGRTAQVRKYIQEYFERVSMFVQVPGQKDTLDTGYIIRKLESDTISCGVQWLFFERKEKTDRDLRKANKEKDEKKEAKKGAVQKKAAEEKKPVPGSQKRIQESEKRRLEEERRYRKAELKRLAQERKRFEAQEQEREQEQAREEFQKVKKRLMDREKAERQEQEKRIAALLEELNALVGLDMVKEEIRSLINLIKVRKMREKLHMPSMDMSYHMVFTGSPGTGKTTVARLVARIYKELGILSEGQLVETDRSRLVAGYVGQTAINVREIVEQAIGGVLFIDEAYALISPDNTNDFGSEAVDTLVKMMEDHRDNLVVIVAGYTEEMKVFLKSNTGLISRFNKFISFDDYSQEQLLDILEVMVKKAGLTIEKAALEKVGRKLSAMTPEEKKDFGNARGVRNIFEKMIMNQANRLVLLEEPDKQQLMALTEEDAQQI